jgi:transcriptional regulator with XRE-family HTH domain
MSNASWAEYTRRCMAGLSRDTVAEAVGVHSSHLGRWMDGKGGLPRAENVISFARAINVPPKEALVAAGYLTRDEADAAIEIAEPLSSIPDAVLLHEIGARLAQREHRP